MNDIITNFGTWLWKTMHVVPLEFITCVERINLFMIVTCLCGFLVMEMRSQRTISQTLPFQIMGFMVGLLAALFIPLPPHVQLPETARIFLLIFVIGLFAFLPPLTAKFLVRCLGYQRITMIAIYAVGLILITVQSIILIWR